MYSTNHKLPLSKSYIIQQFGQGAYQIQSGESIVIITDQKVYKYPLLSTHRENLLKILLQEIVSPRFLVPEKRRFLEFFFVYPKLKPIPVYLAKQSLKKLTKLVVLSLEELHSQGLAHNDVRLDNICFKDGMAVLIDLDMGGQTRNSCMDHTSSDSLMYPRHMTDKKKLDWRQLAIMIVNIEEPRKKNAIYHSKEPNFDKQSRYSHPFIKKLYQEGKRSESNMVIVNLISLYYRGHGSTFT